jgi:hypothetical protein
VALEPDTYAIATDLSGFQAVRQEGIVLELAKQLEINLTLKVASVSESVVVTGSSPIVDVQSSSTSNTISQTLLTSVPILRANAATQILNYAPGTLSDRAEKPATAAISAIAPIAATVCRDRAAVRCERLDDSDRYRAIV